MISPTASPRKEKKIEGLSQQSIAPIVSQGSTVRNELTDSTETPHHTLPKPADRTHKCSFKKSLLTLQTTVLQPHTQLVEDTSGPETGVPLKPAPATTNQQPLALALRFSQESHLHSQAPRAPPGYSSNQRGEEIIACR